MILTFQYELAGLEPSAALARGADILSGWGFVAARDEDAAREDRSFVRGSLLGNLLSYRMDRVRQTARLTCVRGETGATQLTLEYRLSTLGQILLHSDRRFFEQEALALATALGEEREAADALRLRARRGASQRAVLVLGLIAAACGLLLAQVLLLLSRSTP